MYFDSVSPGGRVDRTGHSPTLAGRFVWLPMEPWTVGAGGRLCADSRQMGVPGSCRRRQEGDGLRNDRLVRQTCLLVQATEGEEE